MWRARFFRMAIVILPLTLGIQRANASLWVYAPKAEKDTLADRAQRADIVPIGTTERVVASWEGKHIVSLVTFRVRDTLKGDHVPSEVIVKQRGGTLNGHGEHVSGAPEFHAGESSVLFLRNLSDDPTSPRYAVIDRAFGKIDIGHDELGREVVSLPLPELQRIDRLRLTDLAERVKAALRGSEP
jgi:hypothetical protein